MALPGKSGEEKAKRPKGWRVKERPMVMLTQVVVELDIRQKQQQQLWMDSHRNHVIVMTQRFGVPAKTS